MPVTLSLIGSWSNKTEEMLSYLLILVNSKHMATTLVVSL